jgi:putrescine transport system substrate-binding protein
MKIKTALQGVIAGVALLAAAGDAGAEERQLFIYNWADYIGTSTIADFEKETGIKVTYDLFDGYETMDARVQAGSSGYDIIFPGRYYISQHVLQGVYLPLDKSKLKNLGNIGQRFWDALSVADPGNKYVVPYMFWTNGYVYDAKKVLAIDPNAPVDSWAMFFDPAVLSKFTPCGVSILDSPEDVMDLALNYLHLHPGTNDAAELKQAGDLVAKAQPHVAAFDNSGTINGLADGSRCLAMTWSGDYSQAKARAEENKADVDLKFVSGKEGVNMDYDGMAILKDAKNVDEALEFIDYMMRPDVIAKVTNDIGYANANEKATPLVDPSISGNPAMYPDQSRMTNIFTIGVRTGEGTRVLTREFTRAKTGQ